ncbi:MAG: hypothetical protein EAZ07_09310 [Cytophagales bacterium]|nr:MAG: hypothetical protein EAZ07_09310 [Cytophagales bacterium]
MILVSINYLLAPIVLGFAIMITIPLTFGIIVYFYKEIYLDKFLYKNILLQIAIIILNSILIIIFIDLFFLYKNFLNNSNEFTISTKSTLGLIIITFILIIFWWIVFTVINYFSKK